MGSGDNVDLTGPYQVVIIGAGPAGSVCAFLLASQGKKVLLVDRAVFPRTKVCGSCISARTLANIRAAGLDSVIDELMQTVEAPTISQIILCTASGAITLPLAEGRALSRASLDLALIERAKSAGVVFAQGISAYVQNQHKDEGQEVRKIRLQPVGDQIDAEITIEAQCVVVADGVGGHSLSHLNDGEKEELRPIVAANSRVGAGTVIDNCSTAADSFYKNGTIYMALHRSGYVGAVRLEQNKIDLGAAFDLDFVRSQGSASAAARMVMEASGMPFLDGFDQSPWFGTAPFTRRRHSPAARRLFVIGDAASYGEPFTGEGIGWAIKSALLVVPHVSAALEKWDDNLAVAWQKEQAKIIVGNQKTSLRLGQLLRQSQISAQLIEKILERIPALSKNFLALPNKAKNLAGTR